MVRDVKNITNVNVGWGWNSYLQENNSEEADFGNLTSLHGIEYFESLQSLICDNNPLTELDVSKNTMLTFLSCVDNRLTALDVSHNLSLAGLRCYGNKLTSLNTNNNTMLTYLDCSYNLLTTLDISKNMSLTDFICSFNPGNGTIFPVTAWFDNDAVPVNFSTGSWTFNDQTIAIDYRKAD